MSILWDYRTIIIKSQPLYLDSIHSKMILLFLGTVAAVLATIVFC